MQQSQYKIAIWLLLCCIMILIMVFVGGITRLTHSGLSITEWNPIIGIIPPLNDDDWLQEKNKYNVTPEYKYLNYDITLEEFKVLYLIEYFHRLLGRVTGIIFFVPLCYFIYTKKLNKHLYNFVIIAFLGMLQGLIGWYMVKSGLVDMPYVSHYRLAAHLLLALAVFCLLWKNFLNIVVINDVNTVNFTGMVLLKIIFILIIFQIIYGALVAGLNAGLIFNTFPLMDGEIVPKGLFFMHPWWRNLFDNIITVQFIHRVVAMIIITFVIITTIILRSYRVMYLLCVCTITQFILGIGTLLYHVPIFLAAMHQIMAFILCSISLYILHCTKLKQK
ncbi:COX15/CtaA family protein [Neoehrlichia mikurensis]|uniref:Heme A synthase n=1 Tax=Neoehrlichia mikurensis TaxID=89586 RepID=A0A9Q9BTR5_9RICK|nr:COX15/CtaA family protein [Neoehrlichia mikurensis]QXK91703.1 COX15/CtaA family protein [Neoehrlichia mikurensis]QXK92914.1 COX15/CtaA family protein [Neoehrlichia mikurensis]QXK93394.1 COX15/CtaA family protein [Neoehrlichia mikurensis]UTO55657.1 COX15/CtaA family protein [Neoehrlichia mikurensis]UTO56578.1 COX15/CtaA family protein [Neoehrlichia mikurensis]